MAADSLKSVPPVPPAERPDSAADVLFITHNFPRNETDFAGRFIWRLARELAGYGVGVSVLAPHHPGARELEVLDGIKVHRFRYGNDAQEVVAYRGDLDRWSGSSPVSARATWNFMQTFKRAAAAEIAAVAPRVVHAHWWMPAGWAARKAVRQAGTKFILTSHGTDIRLLNRQWVARFLAGRVYRQAHEITTVSTWLKEQLCDRLNIPPQKVGVIPMPVDRGPFTPGEEPQNNIPIVLSVARFTEQKRLFDLMDAAEILKKRGRPVRYRFVGEGPLKKEIHDRKFVKGLADEITLVETMPAKDLAEEYRKADIVILCSENEGFGMTILEAQLCGRAVIGTRSGGIPDIIEDGRTGLLVEPGQPQAIADALEYLIVDFDERARLAHAGRESANLQFDPSNIAREFIKLYGI